MVTCLLSVKDLKEVSLDSELYKEAMGKVDNSRREKIMRLSSEEKKKVSLGAGLLLQYAVIRYEQDIQKRADVRDIDFAECHEAIPDEMVEGKKMQYGKNAPDVGSNDKPIDCLHVSNIIKEIQNPRNFTYTYGKNGKPYFVNLPIYFNLSHSGDYVLCVVADSEVGADIQQMSDIDYQKTAERFFTQEEVSVMRQLATVEEQKRFFYKLWTYKEAYGKYTGEGVAKAFSVNMIDFPEGTVWEEYDNLNGYCISVCQEK